MSQVFISYSRKDKDFVRKIGDALAAQKREAWVDWKDIPLTAEWQREIFANIEAADNFIFVISPESAASPNCRKEIDHAVANNKRMVPIFYRAVPDDAIPEALEKFQRIDFGDRDNFDSKFASLISALDTDLAWVQVHTRLLTRAKEWERKATDSSFLLRGKDLREAEQWVAKSAEKEPEPTTLHSQYILASRQAATKLQRIIIGAVAAAFVIAVALAVYAFLQKNLAQRETKEAEHQRNVADANARKAQHQEEIAKQETAEAERETRVANSRRLATLALSFKDDRLDLASLLSSEAVRTADTLEARSALLTMFQTSPTLLKYLPHRSAVESVAFSPSGGMLACGGEDGTIQLWNVATWKRLGLPLRHGSAVRSLAFSPNGKFLASAGGGVRVWNVASRTQVGEFGHASVLAFSPDGTTLASQGADDRIVLWDVPGRQLKETPFESPKGMWVGALAFSPDGKSLASISGDNVIRLWDVDSRKLIRQTPEAHHNWTFSLAFINQGKTLVSGSYDTSVIFWDVNNLQRIGGPLFADTVHKLAFTADEQIMAVAEYSATTGFSSVQLWNVAMRQPIGELMHLLRGQVNDVAFSAVGRVLAAASDDKIVRVWDLSRNAFLGEPLRAHSEGSSMRALAFTRDGKWLASGTDDRTAELWDVDTRKPLSEPLRGHEGSLHTVVFDSKDKKLVSASVDGTVFVWDLTRRPPAGSSFRSSKSGSSSIALSPDGSKLASANDDGKIHLFDLTSQHENGEMSLEGRPVQVAFGREGKLLASGYVDGTIRFWDVASRKLIGEPLRGHIGEVYSLAFSPDSKILASSGDDKTVRLWSVDNYKQIGEPLYGHSAGVWGVSFSPDGTLVASASWDGSARLWDVSARQSLGGPFKLEANTPSTRRMWNVAFRPSGKQIATGNDDGTITLWDVNPDSWAARPCRLANRNLTLGEWAQYIGKDVAYHRTCPDLPDGEGVPGTDQKTLLGRQ